MTRLFFFVTAILFAASMILAGEIRQFDVRTLERLGNELSRRDALAAKASDVVFAKHPEFKKVWPQGWVTQLSKAGDAVYWIAETKSGLAAAYKVVFPKGGSPRVEDIHGQSLPAEIAVRYNAKETAFKAVMGKLNAAYGAKYNLEVLDDPDRSGFLVYALAAFKDSAMYLGGHMRVTVSGDGSRIERIDELQPEIIRNEVPTGEKLRSIGTVQTFSNTPVETYIYSSNLYKIPIGVGTPDATFWIVHDGKIYDTGEKVESLKARSAKKKK